ncbi:MAG: recombinase family protein, partial [Planctomycetota bacterium]
MNRKATSTESAASSVVRCAIYTRKSTEEGLEQEFNSLDAQRESAEAYIKSQQHEGWICLPDRYDDGGFTGGNMERPALRRLMADIEAGRIDCVVVYKVDRLSRSLLDFAQLMAKFDKHQIAFVSVTQQFNTTNSMGRLMLNVLLSFAQFEREIISERTRDKIAATRRKGKWCGGLPPLGYDGANTKAFAEWAQQIDKEVLSEAQARIAKEMNDSVTCHPLGAELLARGIPEGVIRAEYRGIPCQIRLDWLAPEYGIVDLKTSDNLSWFESDARKFHYLNQLAFYRSVAAQVTGETLPVYL